MKNLKFLLILLTLSVIAYIALVISSKFSADDKFSYDKINNINKIALYSKNLKTELNYSNEKWTVNGNDVNDESIENLLYAISHLQVKYPISKNIEEKAKQTLAQNGINISVYDNDSKKLNFKIAYLDSVCIGLNNDKTQIYALEIPSTHTPPTDYISANPAFYENNVVFKYLPSQIESVLIENVAEPAETFKIFNKNGQLMLFDVTKQKFAKKADEEKMHAYISYFNGVEYDKALNLSPDETEKIKKLDAAYNLTLTTKNETIAITCKLKPLDEAKTEYGQTYTTDNHYFYLIINDNQTVALARWIDFDILFKNLSDFIKN